MIFVFLGVIGALFMALLLSIYGLYRYRQYTEKRFNKPASFGMVIVLFLAVVIFILGFPSIVYILVSGVALLICVFFNIRSFGYLHGFAVTLLHAVIAFLVYTLLFLPGAIFFLLVDRYLYLM